MNFSEKRTYGEHSEKKASREPFRARNSEFGKGGIYESPPDRCVPNSSPAKNFPAKMACRKAQISADMCAREALVS